MTGLLHGGSIAREALRDGEGRKVVFGAFGVIINIVFISDVEWGISEDKIDRLLFHFL